MLIAGAGTKGAWSLMGIVLLAAGCASGEPLASTPGESMPPGAPSTDTSQPTQPAMRTPGPSASTVAAPPPARPAPDAWVDAGTLATGHGAAWAVALGDQVVVVGADNVCAPGAAWSTSVNTEIGGSDGEWSPADPLPKPRDRFVAAALPDGTLLVAGGTTEELPDSGPRSYSSAYVLGPRTGGWTKTGLMLAARSNPAVATLRDGRVLVVGGYYVNQPDEPGYRVLRSAEIFDSASGTWTATGRMRHARYGAEAVTLADGRVLVVGGWGRADDGPAPLYGTSPIVAEAELFDPATGDWTSAGAPDMARGDPALVALDDGGAILAGGRVYFDAGDFGTGMAPTETSERFHPDSGWTRTGAMRTASAARAAVRLPDGRVLVAGGDVTDHFPDLDPTDDAFTDGSELYDPASGSWASAPRLPGPRSDADALLMENGSVLLVGGFDAPPTYEDTPSCPRPAFDVTRLTFQ